MRRTLLLVLPGLLLCGCRALIRDAEVIEYRPGGVAETTVAKVDAAYRLSAPDKHASWIGTNVSKGGTIGFRQNPDGTVVAFAGEQSWTVDTSDGRHVWLCTPKPMNAWEQLVVDSRDKSEKAFTMLVMYATAPFWLSQCAVTGVWP